MKGFIEVTNTNRNNKILIAVAQIKSIEQFDNYTAISMACVDGKRFQQSWSNLCWGVKESYSEVVEKIKAAE